MLQASFLNIRFSRSLILPRTLVLILELRYHFKIFYPNYMVSNPPTLKLFTIFKTAAPSEIYEIKTKNSVFFISVFFVFFKDLWWKSQAFKGIYPFTIFTKVLIIDVWQGPKYVSVMIWELQRIEYFLHKFTSRVILGCMFWKLFSSGKSWKPFTKGF